MIRRILRALSDALASRRATTRLSSCCDDTCTEEH